MKTEYGHLARKNIEKLEQENKELGQRNEELGQRNEELGHRNEELEKQNEILWQQNKKLQEQFESLREKSRQKDKTLINLLIQLEAKENPPPSVVSLEGENWVKLQPVELESEQLEETSLSQSQIFKADERGSLSNSRFSVFGNVSVPNRLDDKREKVVSEKVVSYHK